MSRDSRQKETMLIIFGTVAIIAFTCAVEALMIAYMWLWLMVPIGFRALLLREAFAVGMFINFFIMQYDLSNNKPEWSSKRRLLAIVGSTGAYMLLSYIYSTVLL